MDILYRQRTDDLVDLAAATRDFVERELIPHEAGVDAQDAMPEELRARLQRKALDIGLYAFNLPAGAGGPGLSIEQQTVVREQLGRTTQAMAEVAHRPPLGLLFADPSQREEFLLPVARGEVTVCLALSESDVGSDLRQIRTKANATGSGWVLNGTKQYISNVDRADAALVLARTESGGNHLLTAFLVRRSDPGYEVGSLQPKMGWRGYHFGELILNDCQIPQGRILGTVGQGMQVAMASVNPGRLTVAAHCVGTSIWCVEQAIGWVKERQLFGAPMSEFQAIRWKIADMVARIAQARALLHDVAIRADLQPDERRLRAEAALVKLVATEMVGEVADAALQLHGAYGYTSDAPIERRYRDVRAFRIGEGASELLIDYLGKELVR